MTDSQLNFKDNVIVNDFVRSIEELQSFLIKSKKRFLNDQSIKVILKNLMQNLKDCINKYAVSFDIDPNLKAKASFESIPKINNILNMISPKEPFEYIWLELQALSNMVIMSLTNVHSAGDLWSIQASSNLLVKILMGIPRIKELPELPSPITHALEFREKFSVYFNSLQFTALVYYGVIIALPAIRKEDLEVWLNEAFWHYRLLNNLVERIDWSTAIKSYKNDLSKFYLNIALNAQVLINLALLCDVGYRLLGASLPESVDTQGFIKEFSLEENIRLFDYLHDIGQNHMNTLETMSKDGLLNVNDNPFEREEIKEINITIKLFEMLSSIYQTFKIGLPLNKQCSEKELEEIESAINSTIGLASWYNSYLISRSGNDIFNSEAGEGFVEQIVLLIELWVLRSFWSGNSEYFYERIREFDWIFQKVDLNKFPELIIKKSLAQLFLECSFNSNLKVLREIRDQFRILNFHLPTLHRPRDLLAVTILETILTYYLQDYDSLDVLEQKLREKKDILFDFDQNYILFDYEQFVVSLINQMRGSKSLLYKENSGVHSKRSSLNYLDSYSWLIPDFHRVASETQLNKVTYLPFNRFSDKIIPKKEVHITKETSKESRVELKSIAG